MMDKEEEDDGGDDDGEEEEEEEEATLADMQSGSRNTASAAPFASILQGVGSDGLADHSE